MTADDSVIQIMDNLLDELENGTSPKTIVFNKQIQWCGLEHEHAIRRHLGHKVAQYHACRTAEVFVMALNSTNHICCCTPQLVNKTHNHCNQLYMFRPESN
jgi:hypothetical protein